MTRKEVCRATGLSVKTLRLYEEKGLIAPARERRNGREYREYTPELVEQLERIVMLRRALFTMDEIKTMQAQPEKIPEIFRSYQQWLEQQEAQFQRLCQAAEQVRETDLTSIDGLLTGMREAASDMPLPAVDVKPNFKRIDEMDEGPRHVEAQRYFDELVPDEKVFRQVNLALDRDKANDINLAFGQYNQLRRDWKVPEQSGPVQRERVIPKWLKVINGIMTGGIILGLVITIGSVAQVVHVRDTRPIWNLTWILFLARLATMVVPAWLDHRRWLKQAQQEDYQRQQKYVQTDFDDYAKERKHWRKYLLPGIAVCVLLIGGSLGLYFLIDGQMNPDADYRVCLDFPYQLSEKSLYDMGQVLAPMVGDLDGNGEEVVVVDQGMLGWTEAEEDSYPLQFIVDMDMPGRKNPNEYKYYRYCRRLPEDLAEDPEDFSVGSYRVELTGATVFQAAGLGELVVYGCISKSATDEEYELAVEVLRKILADQ